MMVMRVARHKTAKEGPANIVMTMDTLGQEIRST